MPKSENKVLKEKRYPAGHRITLYEPNDKSNLIITIDRSHTKARGRDFSFILKNHSLVPVAGAKHGVAHQEKDWYKALSETEKVDLMQLVAAQYRRFSLDPDGMKTAAIGVVENPEPASPANAERHHLIFVGVNTTSDVSKIDKRCAERNTIDHGKQSMLEHMTLHVKSAQPAPNRFKEMFVMGGRDANPQVEGDQGISAICPCGLCTDMLAQEMKANGHVYVLPCTDGWADVAINTKEKDFSQLGEDSHGKPQVWKRTIADLNQHRTIRLSDEAFEQQVDGIAELARKLSDYHPPSLSEAVKDKLVENAQKQRKSIAQLDVATDGKGNIPAWAVDDYLFNELLATLHDRVKRDFDHAPDRQELQQWLTEKVDMVRCCVIRSDGAGKGDPCYFIGKDSQTGSDKAFQNAESAAISSAIDSLGNQGVAKVWSMEFNPRQILQGNLITATKDGLERIFKRRTREPGKEVTVCNLMLNDGLEPEQVEALAAEHTFPISEMLPGRFGGSGIEAKHRKQAAPADEKPRFVDKVVRPKDSVVTVATTR